METPPTLDAQLDARKKEIERIDGEIREIDTQLDKMKGSYPKLLTPPNPHAKEYLDKAKDSDWSNDEVSVSGDAEALTLTNLTKREKLIERINAAKLEAADLAFRFIEMTEGNSTTHARDLVGSEIRDKKKMVQESTEKMKAMGSTEVHFSFSGHRSDFENNPSVYVIAALALMREGTPQVLGLMNHRVSYKDLLNSLKAQYEIGMDPQSVELIRKTYNDLVMKKDDLLREKRA